MLSMPRTQMTQAILCPNPSMMTLQGTKTYIISAPGSDAVTLVDPGPANYPGHLKAVTDAVGSRSVELILLTHHHADHSGAALHFSDVLEAPLRAYSSQWCRNAEPLAHEERILVGDAVINVQHTPGHTSDSVSFFLAADGESGSVLTGDTILGQGTTMLDFPDGSLNDYLASLDTLADLESEGPVKVLPAHGPELPDVKAVAEQYIKHRQERLAQFEAFLGKHAMTLEDIVGQETRIAAELYGVQQAKAGPMGLRITVQMVQAMVEYLQGH